MKMMSLSISGVTSLESFTQIVAIGVMQMVLRFVGLGFGESWDQSWFHYLKSPNKLLTTESQNKF